MRVSTSLHVGIGAHAPAEPRRLQPDLTRTGQPSRSYTPPRLAGEHLDDWKAHGTVDPRPMHWRAYGLMLLIAAAFAVAADRAGVRGVLTVLGYGALAVLACYVPAGVAWLLAGRGK